MLSAVVVTFIHGKGRSRWINGLEAYAYKHMYTRMSHIFSSERTSRLPACLFCCRRCI